MLITNSPDLGVLEVKCVIDLTGANPVINLTNETTANPNVSPIPPLDTLQWVLNIYSPTGTPIYQSDFNTPWQTGVWTTAQITSPWPRPFGQIEWSGADYLIQFQVKDTVGTIYDLDKVATICRPTGNTQKSTNTFGVVALSVEVMCDSANLYIKDNTSKTYKGLTGILASSYLAIDYPRDPTGVKPDPFIITSFTTDALVPFTFNSKGYEATYYSIYTYDLGDNVFLQIRYTAQVLFDVLCNIDLCPLACEVKGLEESIQSGKCADIDAAQAKLNLITPKLLRAFIAKANPTCGIDLADLIEGIKEIGGFNCDCYGASTGISTSAVTSNFIFSVNNQGGDVVAYFQQTGANVVLTIKDRSYTFGPSSGAAIILVPSASGTNTDVQLQYNINQLATEIYNETAGNTTLLNLFNSLVLGGGFNLQVDGKCVISNGACDYVYTLSGLPSVANAFLSFIYVNGIAQTLNYAFNTTTLTALETYLNTLGLGTFVVADLGGGTITITTNTNSFNLGNIVYAVAIGQPKKIATLNQDCAGFTSLTANQIVQAIIDYLCALDDSQVKTFQDYTICYFDPISKTSKTETVIAGSRLTDFIIELLARGCDTITYISSLKSGGGNLSGGCAETQAAFPVSINPMQANDFVLGTKAGECARIYPVEFGTRQLELGIYDPNFMAAFCNAVTLCAAGLMCEPYNVFNIATVENSPADNKLDIIVTFDHPSAISSFIRYARIDLGGVLDWSIPAIVLPGASPYTIANVDDGQYVVGITPVYADGRKCSEITKNTAVCGSITSFSAVLSGTDINVTYTATSPKVKVNVTYPNGGFFSMIYNNGASIVVTPPDGLTGFYSITMQSVCNATTGWFGPLTAPAIIEVTPTNNSMLTNNTSNDLTSVSLQYNNGAFDTLVFTIPTLAASGGVQNFYLADGFYPEISINYATGTVGTATLTTDTGVVVGTIGSNITFANVTILNGAAISLIDASPAP